MAKKQEEQYDEQGPELDEVEGLDSMTFGVDDELDLEGEGYQARRVDLKIENTEIQHKDTGELAMVTFVAVNEGDIPYSIRETFWLRHDNEKAQNIGRGGVKRLFKAALGQSKGSLGSIRGLVVSAWVREDAEGRLTAGSYQAVKADAEAETVAL